MHDEKHELFYVSKKTKKGINITIAHVFHHAVQA